MNLTLYSFLIGLSALIRILLATFAIEQDEKVYGDFHIQVSAVLFIYSIFDGMRAEYFVSKKKVIFSKKGLIFIRFIVFFSTYILIDLDVIFCTFLVFAYSFNNGLLANKLAEDSNRKLMLNFKAIEILILISALSILLVNLYWALLIGVLANSIATRIMLIKSEIIDIEYESINLIKTTHFWAIIFKSFIKYMDIYLVNHFQPGLVPLFKYIKSLSNLPNILSTLLTDFFRRRVELSLKWVISFFVLHAVAGAVVWFILDLLSDIKMQYIFITHKEVLLLYFLLYGIIGYSRVLFLKYSYRTLLLTPISYVIFLILMLVQFKIDGEYLHLVSQSSVIIFMLFYAFSNYKSICRKKIFT